MEKVLKHEFSNIFNQMVEECKRLYPTHFDEPKTKKLAKYVKKLKDTFDFKKEAIVIHDILQPFEQDLKNSNVEILEKIVLFNNLIDFSMFKNDSETRKKIIVKYLYQYHQCCSLVLMETQKDMVNYLKNMEENQEHTELIKRILNNPVVQEVMTDIEKEMKKQNITPLQMVDNLVSGNHNKQTKKLIHKIGSKHKDKILNDQNLKKDIEPLLDTIKDFIGEDKMKKLFKRQV
jgi:hypothetical protein